MTKDEFFQFHRDLVVSVASQNLGATDPTPFWRDVLGPAAKYPKHWCGAFGLYCLHVAGIAKDVGWQIGKGISSLGFPTTKTPQRGDWAYFKAHQHHALVVTPGSNVHVIQGNSKAKASDAPHVRDSWHDSSEVAAFYSIQPFLEKLWAEYLRGA